MFISQELYKRFIRGSRIMKVVASLGLLLCVFVLYNQMQHVESETLGKSSKKSSKKGPKVTKIVGIFQSSSLKVVIY